MNPLMLLGLLGAGAVVALSQKPKVPKEQKGEWFFYQYWSVYGDCTQIEYNLEFKDTNNAFYNNFWLVQIAQDLHVISQMPLSKDLIENVNEIFASRYYNDVCYKLNTELSLFLYIMELYITSRNMTLVNRMKLDVYQKIIFDDIPTFVYEKLKVSMEKTPNQLFLDTLSDEEIIVNLYDLLRWTEHDKITETFIYKAPSTALALGLYTSQFLYYDNKNQKTHFYNLKLDNIPNAKRYDRLIRIVDIVKKLATKFPNNDGLSEAEETLWDIELDKYLNNNGMLK